MRNKAAQNDKYGQGSLSTRPLHFTSILRVSAHAKKTPSIAWTCYILYPYSCNLGFDCLFPVALPFPLQFSCAECRLCWCLPVQAHVRTLIVIEVDSFKAFFTSSMEKKAMPISNSFLMMPFTRSATALSFGSPHSVMLILIRCFFRMPV